MSLDASFEDFEHLTFTVRLANTPANLLANLRKPVVEGGFTSISPPSGDRNGLLVVCAMSEPVPGS